MKAFIILSCVATFAVCVPLIHDSHHKHHNRRRPHVDHQTAEKEPTNFKEDYVEREEQKYPAQLGRFPEQFQKLPALRHEEVHDEYGQYALRFITAQNTVMSERGLLVPSSNGGYVMQIEGKYQFIGDDGRLYVTEYIGGPDGFHVTGNHLPVQPTADNE